MDRRALILGGGGGVTGIAWKTGLIAGLAGLGIDLAAADVVIGTSGLRIRGRRIAVVDVLASSAPDCRLGCDHDPVTRVARKVPEAAGRVVLAMVAAP